MELRRQALSLEQRVYEQHEDLDEARLEMLQRLARASEYRDDDTGEHTQRVGRTSALVARELGLGEEEVTLIRHAATLHDVGKIAIPDYVLLKPGKLTDEERELMKTHARTRARAPKCSRRNPLPKWPAVRPARGGRVRPVAARGAARPRPASDRCGRRRPRG